MNTLRRTRSDRVRARTSESTSTSTSTSQLDAERERLRERLAAILSNVRTADAALREHSASTYSKRRQELLRDAANALAAAIAAGEMP